MAKVTVVHLIPTFNEAENVELLIPKLQKLYKKHAAIKFITLFVDDSRDHTPKVIQSFQKKDKTIVLIFGHGQGLGAAMVQGYRYAIAHLKPDIIITNEADFAYDHTKIPLMIKKISQGFDVVVASRHVYGGTAYGWSWSRHLNHWVANTFFADWVAEGSYVTDHNGAFRAIRVKGVLDQLKWKGFPLGFAFFNYQLFKLHEITSKFYEFPITYRFRTRGESKISFNFKHFKSYLRNVAEYILTCINIRNEMS